MLLSLVTLSDSSAHLPEAYAALAGQDHQDWEWVIGPVGNTGVPVALLRDPRVVVIDLSGASGGALALRRRLVGAAAGSHVLELDQHDVPVPGALGAVAAAAERGADVVHGAVVHLGDEPASAAAGAAPAATRPARLGPHSLGDPDRAPLDGFTWRRSTFLDLTSDADGLGTSAAYALRFRAYLAGVSATTLDRCVVASRRKRYERRRHDLDAAVARAYLPAAIDAWAARNDLTRMSLDPEQRAALAATGRLAASDATIGVLHTLDLLALLRPCGTGCAHDAGCVVGALNEVGRVLHPTGWASFDLPADDPDFAAPSPYGLRWNSDGLRYLRAPGGGGVPGLRRRFDAVLLRETDGPDGLRLTGYLRAEGPTEREGAPS